MAMFENMLAVGDVEILCRRMWGSRARYQGDQGFRYRHDTCESEQAPLGLLNECRLTFL